MTPVAGLALAAFAGSSLLAGGTAQLVLPLGLPVLPFHLRLDPLSSYCDGDRRAPRVTRPTFTTATAPMTPTMVSMPLSAKAARMSARPSP